ncbi:protein mono-ADP-ribosyltransferase PARP12-like isoform X2 [Homarus americanus]|uniref:protein mono-ADP-ribosyltransferase PARP12-like isoform X2 n=2 Tax=Homarus americanus TaxID=6706 RepID=UPI001C46BE2C|nr:protein mono-ADP-ribosyltransferase PARP12-like isoform X2 [Homarus americanus]
MGDQGGRKGQSRQQGNKVDADAIRFEERARNLERAAKDMQKMLKDIAIEKTKGGASQKPPNKTPNKPPNKPPDKMNKVKGNQGPPQAQRGGSGRGRGRGYGGMHQNVSSQQQHWNRHNDGLLGLPPCNPSAPKLYSGYHGPTHHENRGPQHFQGPRPPYYPPQGPHAYEVPQYDFPSHFGEPPPSYEESSRKMPLRCSSSFDCPPQVQSTPEKLPPHCQGKYKKMAPPSRSVVEELVKAMTLFKGQWCTAETLSRQVQKSVEELMEVVKSCKNIFSFMEGKNGVMIELVPKVNLCSAHLSEEGCLSPGSCKNLHLCKTFVMGFCNAGASCQFGHRWETDHNNSLLSKLHLSLIDKNDLRLVIRKVCRGKDSPKICYFYNDKNGCRNNEKCNCFHICKDFVVNRGKCSVSNCSLNHNLFTDNCKRLFKRYDISINESPRDILIKLMSLTQDDNQQSSASANVNTGDAKDEGKKKAQKSEPKDNSKNDASTVSSGKSANEGEKKGKKSAEKKEEDSSSDSDSDSSSEQSDAGDSHSKGQKKYKKERKANTEGERKPKKKKSTTVNSTDVCGDVQIPEVCIFAVNDKCINTKKGCKYLHAKSLFHWQFEKEKKWYNFRVFQSKALENAYRDVSNGGVQIPPFDESKLESFAKDMLMLLGTESWMANFQDMTLNNSSRTKQLNIRRLSTRSATVSASPKSTVFEWYFLDEQGKWIRYGQVDSLGKQELVCHISSEDIEKQYLSDPTSSMIICNAHFNYKLDFSQMTQINQNTNTAKEIRRRPSRLSYQRPSPSDSVQSSLPAHWIPMGNHQTHFPVTLVPNDKEFLEVAGRVRLMLPTANIQKIQRLQNPYLWHLLQNKKADLSQRYDENQLNFQKLFYGTDPSKIDTICKENIDWQHGTTFQQDYGKGAYFSNSAAVARSHCTVDGNGHFFVLLAGVIIGTVTKGTPTLTRPPTNLSTGKQYDTTVDDVHAPTIFVKYDKGEYYPEYIIEFY